MGCNAWNHHPDCNCGWGGEGHNSRFAYSHWRHKESYVNPNARCPMCGEGVYFYRSEHGGCAYFDEMGPPWPKHPCMDSPDRVRPAKKPSQLSQGKPRWRLVPYTDIKCDAEVGVLVFTIGDVRERRFLYAEPTQFPVDSGAPFLLVKNGAGYRVSTLTVRPDGVVVGEMVEASRSLHSLLLLLRAKNVKRSGPATEAEPAPAMPPQTQGGANNTVLLLPHDSEIPKKPTRPSSPKNNNGSRTVLHPVDSERRILSVRGPQGEKRNVEVVVLKKRTFVKRESKSKLHKVNTVEKPVENLGRRGVKKKKNPVVETAMKNAFREALAAYDKDQSVR